LDRANKEYADQLESFTEFSTQQADRVPQWKKKVEDFEADPTQPNPYRMKRTGTSSIFFWTVSRHRTKNPSSAD
jgi:hypothetical protein